MEKPIEILLVEDTPSDIRLTQEALKDTDLTYNLNVVTDGEAGVEYLKSSDADKPRPNLILLDLNMPKKNGHQVLEEIKDIPELAKIPVILLTVSRDEEDILKALHLKMNYYLSKPVTSEKLSVLLKAIHSLHWDESQKTKAVAATGEDAHVRYVMAGNPHTSPAILEKLAQEQNHTIRCRVGENPQTPVRTLGALSKDDHPEVRLSVAENPNTPLTVLEELAKDNSEDVRMALAENPKLPLHILRQLSSDENMYVMTSATKTLSTLTQEEGKRA